LTVLDTSVFVTLLAEHDERHRDVVAWYADERGPTVTTPLAVAEMDYMLRKHGTKAGVRALLTNLGSGALQVRWWPEALDTTLRVARAREDIGLTDASLVALAAHLGTTRIATLDDRHFRTLKPLTGEDAFTLLPADAD
jgi:predicted nucleic acid-binding protein